MKKGVIVLGCLLGLLAAAVFGFWFGWLRAPEPEEVCANVSAIMKQDLGAVPKGFEHDCVRQSQPPSNGRLPYANHMKCLRDAKSTKDIEACARVGLSGDW
jgi:hypothetical protein